jgi:hypothetical protein
MTMSTKSGSTRESESHANLSGWLMLTSFVPGLGDVISSAEVSSRKQNSARSARVSMRRFGFRTGA